MSKNATHRDEQNAARARKSRGRLLTIRQQQKRIEGLLRSQSSMWHQLQDANRRAAGNTIYVKKPCRCWWCQLKGIFND